LSGCEGEGTGSAPQNFSLVGTNYGQEVLLSWEEPSEGTPNSYVVYFLALDTTDFVAGATVDNDSLAYTHDPGGMTGDYYVAAKFGSTEYSSDTLTTIPVHTDVLAMTELNAPGYPGYGWTLTAGFTGATYSMTEVTNAGAVDFYVTNLKDDSLTPPWPAPWNIACPDTAPLDPGGSQIPQAPWRENYFSDPLLDPQVMLPNFAPTTYFKITSGIEVDTTYIGVFLGAEEHYGLVKFFGADTTTGTILVESWFQTVQGLRLLAH
jgi:hypothetical protein